MGRKSTAKADLIEAGKYLFHKYGYQKVSISQLCERASVRSGTFFYFFKTKEAFAKEVVDHTWEDFDNFLLEQLSDLSESPTQRFLGFLEAVYYYIKGQPEEFENVVGCPIGSMILELTSDEQLIQERLIQAIKDATSSVEVVIRDAVAKGEMIESDPHETAQMLIAGVEGIWLLSKAHNDPELVKRLLRKLLRVVNFAPEIDIVVLSKGRVFS